MRTFENFGLLAEGCICHFWQSSGTHRLPFQHPHLDAGVEKSPFALCFLSSPRQCILHSSCGEECCRRSESVFPSVWGVQGICAPSRVCHDLGSSGGQGL